MATYTELRKLFAEGELRNNVEVACIIAALAIWEEDGATEYHAERIIWARQAFSSPEQEAEKLLLVLLATNKGLATSAILGASDAAIQAAVDSAINLFATG